MQIKPYKREKKIVRLTKFFEFTSLYLIDKTPNKIIRLEFTESRNILIKKKKFVLYQEYSKSGTVFFFFINHLKYL